MLSQQIRLALYPNLQAAAAEVSLTAQQHISRGGVQWLTESLRPDMIAKLAET